MLIAQSCVQTYHAKITIHGGNYSETITYRTISTVIPEVAARLFLSSNYMYSMYSLGYMNSLIASLYK
jgi:hypothetical protein